MTSDDEDTTVRLTVFREASVGTDDKARVVEGFILSNKLGVFRKPPHRTEVYRWFDSTGLPKRVDSEYFVTRDTTPQELKSLYKAVKRVYRQTVVEAVLELLKFGNKVLDIVLRVLAK